MSKLLMSTFATSNNPYSWETASMTIEDFFKWCLEANLNPEGQRPSVDRIKSKDKITKAQSIIEAILDKQNIGVVIFCLYEGRRTNIDGGHRSRAICDFINGKFRLAKHSKYGAHTFKELPLSVRDDFMKYSLLVTQYGELPDWKIGEIFRSVNNTTPVDHQEMLNSFGANKVATLVRRTVRYIDDVGNEIHPFFESSITSKGAVKYDYLDFDNHRLYQEEVVARFLHRLVVENGTPGNTVDADLFKMYNNLGVEFEKNPKLEEDARKKLNDMLDFFLKIGQAYVKKNEDGFTKNELSMLFRFYLHMNTTHKRKWVVSNPDMFAREFLRTIAYLGGKNAVHFDFTDNAGRPHLRSEVFFKYLSFDSPSREKYFRTIEWFFDTFDMKRGGVQFVDSTRTFSKEDIKSKWILQGQKDWVDGKKITLQEACGAHIKAWSNGGSTTVDNLVVTSRAHNAAMGTMCAKEYKEKIMKDAA